MQDNEFSLTHLANETVVTTTQLKLHLVLEVGLMLNSDWLKVSVIVTDENSNILNFGVE